MIYVNRNNLVILINVFSLKKFEVPRDVLDLEPSLVRDDSVSQSCCSPRLRGDGSCFYLACENVAYVSMSNKILSRAPFNDERWFLETSGLKNGKDFITLGGSNVNWQWPSWIKHVGEEENMGLFEINQANLQELEFPMLLLDKTDSDSHSIQGPPNKITNFFNFSP